MENQLLDGDMLKNGDGKSLSEILTNGYETHSTDYIKKGFEIFKQNIGGFLGFLVLLAVINVVLSAIPFIGIIGNALIAPIAFGSIIVSKMIDKQETYSFSNFFDGTKKYKSLFLVSLITSLIIFIIFLVFVGWTYFKMNFLGIGRPSINYTDMNSMMAYSANMQMYSSKLGIAGLIVMLISIFLLFGNFFAYFADFEPLKALDTSRKIIGKKFFNWLGFLLLLVLFNFVGALCLGIGLLVTIPSSMCAMYVAYEDVVGLNLKD